MVCYDKVLGLDQVGRKGEMQAWIYGQKRRRQWHGRISPNSRKRASRRYDDVKPGMKRSTWLTKETIIWSKIGPYLGQRKVSEITAKDVIDWQNTIRKLKNSAGKPISPTYLKTIHGQLSAIFNHAMKFYDLAANPAQKAGTMGAEESKEMEFWTKEEYLNFPRQ
ncbi:MAG: hypothetical protein ACLURP_12130 [Ruminococcus sp.]